MIRKHRQSQHGDTTYVAICDRCDDDYETDETDFMQAVAAAKRAHWKPRQEGAVWHHYCPFCWTYIQREEEMRR